MTVHEGIVEEGYRTVLVSDLCVYIYLFGMAVSITEIKSQIRFFKYFVYLSEVGYLLTIILIATKLCSFSFLVERITSSIILYV